MEKDGWTWFSWGVVLGLLLGLGIAAGFSLEKIAAVRAEAKADREQLIRHFDAALYHRLLAETFRKDPKTEQRVN